MFHYCSLRNDNVSQFFVHKIQFPKKVKPNENLFFSISYVGCKCGVKESLLLSYHPPFR